MQAADKVQKTNPSDNGRISVCDAIRYCFGFKNVLRLCRTFADSSLLFVVSSEAACQTVALCEGWRHLNVESRDLIRSLPVRSTSGLPVYVAASPIRSILDFARDDDSVIKTPRL